VLLFELAQTQLVLPVELGPEAAAAQRLGGERPDATRLGLSARGVEALQHERPCPGQGQLGGEQQPDRPRTHHDHVGVHGDPPVDETRRSRLGLTITRRDGLV